MSLSLRVSLAVCLVSGTLACSSASDGGDIPPENDGGGETGDDTSPSDDTAIDPDAPPPSDAPGTDTTPPPGDTTPPTVPGAAYGTKCTGMSANELKAWEEVAIIRGKAKMDPLNCYDGIQTGTRAHCNYSQLNGWVLTHVETVGKPGFTGVNFWDRMKAGGFTGPGSAMFETAHSTGSADGALLGESGWINTLYHRIPYVSYGAAGYGYGGAGAGYPGCSTMDFSSGGKVPSPTVISTWPVDGDTGIWTTFRCASEIPNPLPGKTFAGYPVSITGGSAVDVPTHTITGPSGDLPHAFITKKTDTSGLVPAEQVYLIPNDPLTTSTKYTVKMAGTVGTAPFSVTFSFTTGTK
jgi:hypothetical protein